MSRKQIRPQRRRERAVVAKPSKRLSLNPKKRRRRSFAASADMSKRMKTIQVL
jgi:hypothetical protein